MDVKDAVALATGHVVDLFDKEDVSNVGLEEVEFDPSENQWLITIGFSRPWDYPQGALAVLSASGGGRPSRSYKVVVIDDGTGKVLSIKNRETGNSK